MEAPSIRLNGMEETVLAWSGGRQSKESVEVRRASIPVVKIEANNNGPRQGQF